MAGVGYVKRVYVHESTRGETGGCHLRMLPRNERKNTQFIESENAKKRHPLPTAINFERLLRTFDLRLVSLVVCLPSKGGSAISPSCDINNLQYCDLAQ